MSILNIYLPNFVCVLTNEGYKTYQTEFVFGLLGNAPGVGFWGTKGAHGLLFFKHSHVVYQLDGVDKQYRRQATCLS